MSQFSDRPYNPDRLKAKYYPPMIHNLKQLYAVQSDYGSIPTGWSKKVNVAKKCRGVCDCYPKFTRWLRKNEYRYCRVCEKAVLVTNIILKNRCPCCKQCVRFTSTWTETKRLRTLWGSNK